ncbi:hypothetical protein M979_2326 [Buttiauxella noackiae ATCC 51607]|uniref:Uncharacterized protein n=1 Tax=Buttiauxella noackiae ATCC 51607 TaxID=1354255 RepID=A0A1B7HNH7_9ENTR|nr:hypothetical protein M979_2326 [Buttiauxella noackiae ATCC 51607]
MSEQVVQQLAPAQVQYAAPVGPTLAVQLAEAFEQAVVPVDGQQVAEALADVQAQQELPDAEQPVQADAQAHSDAAPQRRKVAHTDVEEHAADEAFLARESLFLAQD